MSDDAPSRRPLWEKLAAEGLWARGKDGHDYLIRPVRPSDAPLISRSYETLSERSKWFRFHHAQPHLPDEMLAAFCAPDPAREVGIVVEGQGALRGEIVGAARVIGIGPGKAAEFAVTFRSEVRGRGLARQALETVIGAAREAGCDSVRGAISARNEAMLHLARRIGFTTRRDPDDPSLVVAEIAF